MVVTVGAGIDKLASQIGPNGSIRIAGRAGAKLDPLFRKRRLRSAAYAAANQNIDPLICKKPGQGFMTVSVGTNNLRGYYLSVLYFIYLERFCMSEMLKHFSVFVSHRDLHH